MGESLIGDPPHEFRVDCIKANASLRRKENTLASNASNTELSISPALLTQAMVPLIMGPHALLVAQAPPSKHQLGMLHVLHALPTVQVMAAFLRALIIMQDTALLMQVRTASTVLLVHITRGGTANAACAACGSGEHTVTAGAATCAAGA